MEILKYSCSDLAGAKDSKDLGKFVFVSGMKFSYNLDKKQIFDVMVND